jgi:putative flippase GtrA
MSLMPAVLASVRSVRLPRGSARGRQPDRGLLRGARFPFGRFQRRQQDDPPEGGHYLQASRSAQTARCAVFFGVGALGFLVQIAALAALMSVARWTWLPATLVSVELAVLHNFCWHEHWTWRHRTLGRAAPLAPLHRLLRFHLANGLLSIAGNAALMALLVGIFGLHALPANALAVAAMSIVNFTMADRWVFRAAAPLERASAFVTCLALIVLGASLHADANLGPADQPETLAAWERYVAVTEARLEQTRTSAAPPGTLTTAIAAGGDSLHVPGGTISDWRGSVFIPRITLDRLLSGLQHPGTPPPQEDVVSSRVIERGPDLVRVSIRLVRHAIVTVTYDTEHEMRFRRWTSRLATARSVATRIEEVGGDDHGFLWRLHSYWRYEEVDGGVLVDLESLTLSRNVPSFVRPIAAPLVNRIARESMVRTLEALRGYLKESR